MESFFQESDKISSFEFTPGTEQLAFFEQMGLLDKVALRNYRIRNDFAQLQSEGLKMRDIEEILGDKYFLSPESIHRIMYDSRAK